MFKNSTKLTRQVHTAVSQRISSVTQQQQSRNFSKTNYFLAPVRVTMVVDNKATTRSICENENAECYFRGAERQKRAIARGVLSSNVTRGTGSSNSRLSLRR
jgi:hypothetical protein